MGTDTFKVVIAKLRKERKLTQAELAKILGVSASTVSMWENGERAPVHAMVKKIADFFNVDMDYLYGRTNIRQHMSIDNDGNIQLTVTPEEKRLLDYFSKLNDLGKEKVLEDMGDLLQLPKYTVKKGASADLVKIG